jgi:hypothetical protein
MPVGARGTIVMAGQAPRPVEVRYARGDRLGLAYLDINQSAARAA